MSSDQLTITIPQTMAADLQKYRKKHPSFNFSGFVQEKLAEILCGEASDGQ
jgi:hypothetical protein